MKKVKILFHFLIVIAVTLSVSINDALAKTSYSEPCEVAQVRSVPAFIMWGGNWRSGQLSFIQTENGYKTVSYQFEDYGNNQLRGQFYPDQQFKVVQCKQEKWRKRKALLTSICKLGSISLWWETTW